MKNPHDIRGRRKICLDTVLYRIRKTREQRFLSQAFMAQALNMSEVHYAKLESGVHQLTLDVVFDICALLNVQPDEVLAEIKLRVLK